MIELRIKIERHLDKGEINLAMDIADSIINDNLNIEENLKAFTKVGFASYYIEIAEAKKIACDIKEVHGLVNKAFAIFNQFAADVPELEQFIHCNKAYGNMIKSDSFYIQKNKGKNIQILTYEYDDSIFEIKEFISTAIKNYWEALSVCDDSEEIYNIKNNLSMALSRVGRNVESLVLLEENINNLPNRWQSNATFADSLSNIINNSLVPETPSLHVVIAGKYYTAIKLAAAEGLEIKMERKLLFHSNKLKEMGYELNEQLVEANLLEEKTEYLQHNEYRKFVLSNNLFLSEHALYCKCKDSNIDNLKIGLSSGSSHLSKSNIIPKLDALLNRIISEYAYSRLLYYYYVSGLSFNPNDLDFSTLSNFDLTGYNIEQLRTSYRIAYGVLDKIANGCLILLDIKKNNSRDSYFENVFDMYKNNFEKIKNIHLTALYSISLDLNKDYGSLRYYKKFRNELEHGFLAINEKTTDDFKSLTESEMREFTLALLKLTRSAIFSFTFLIRTETISSF